MSRTSSLVDGIIEVELSDVEEFYEIFYLLPHGFKDWKLVENFYFSFVRDAIVEDCLHVMRWLVNTDQYGIDCY